MGKIRNLFKKIRYQRNISCKDGHNKGQKWYGPNRSRDIKKRWQEYTEELYKKDLLSHFSRVRLCATPKMIQIITMV